MQIYTIDRSTKVCFQCIFVKSYTRTAKGRKRARGDLLKVCTVHHHQCNVVHYTTTYTINKLAYIHIKV